MPVGRAFVRGLRALFLRPEVDREVADEVAHYFEEATDAHQARGLSVADARRAARLECGSPALISEQVRASGWESAVETLLADLRHATRRLFAAPGFTASVVLTLAIGVGATTVIFGAANPILLQPLPYPASDRITMIWEAAPNGSRVNGTFGTYRALVERARSFDAVAALKAWQPTLTGRSEPERLDGQRVSASYFRVLGVPPALGQDFQAADDHGGGARTVILSDALWRRRFGGDRAIIGRSISLDDDPFVVIGVMPRGFENVLAPSAEAWTLLQYELTDGRAWGHHLQLVGRLRSGVSIAQARSDLDGIAPELKRLAAGADGFFPGGLAVVSLHDDITRGVRSSLYVIAGAVALVLVMACVNVTNLLLARGAHRRGEFAVRAALGATSGRLVRQMLVESLMLAALGGAGGLAVALIGVRALVRLSPPGLPRVDAIGVSVPVAVFALAITSLIGLTVGAIPALQAARSDPHRDLEANSPRAAGGHRRIRSVLVTAEVALAFALLVSAGLLLRSIERLFAVAPGFDSSHLVTMQIQTSGHRFDADTTTYRFFAQALEQVRRVPGVASAALTSQLALSGEMDEYGAHFEASPTRAAASYSVFRYSVSPGYIETMRIPLRRGRSIVEEDGAAAPRVALISEALARRRFAGMDAIGQRLRLGPMLGDPYTIVGVVSDVKQVSLALSASEAVYIPATQSWFADNAMSLVVRSPADPGALAPAIRRAIWSVDRNQPIVRVATMEELVATSTAQRRFALMLFEAFALAALVLAAAGIHGVLAGSVAERTREIGVRSALGATRGRILGLVVREGMTLTALGVAAGGAGAVVATRAIASMLFGTSPLDPTTYVGVAAILAAVALAACAVPASRAARVDPISAMRAE